MVEFETIDDLRSSLARRRSEADETLARVEQTRMRIPDAAQLLHSPPAEFALRHPVMVGIAVGAIYLIGPLRLLRIVATVATIVQGAVSAHAAYRQLAPCEETIDEEFD